TDSILSYSWFSLNPDGQSYRVVAGDGTLSGYISIPSTYNGLPVTAIDNGAFILQTGITHVSIPESVTSIGDSAFYNCGLKGVYLPTGLTEIGDKAFNACNSLVKINLPNKLTYIGSSAFANCSALTSVVLPASLEHLGSKAFTSCGALITADLSAVSLTTIPYEAFSYCYTLANVKLSDTITIIDANAFNGCQALVNINLGKIRTIGDNAFYSATNLANIDLSSLESVGQYAFSGNTKLTSVSLPSSLSTVTYGAFNACSNLTYLHIPEGVVYLESYEFNGSNLTNVVLPSTIKYMGPSAIGTKVKTLYSYATIPPRVVSETLPSSITNIYVPVYTADLGGDKIVNDYKNANYWSVLSSYIKMMNLDGFTAWGGNFVGTIQAYTGTSSLVCVPSVFHNGNYYRTKIIDDNAFKNNTFVEIVYIPEGVETIGNSVFSGCTNLKRVYLPSTLTSIGDEAFSGCTNLIEVVFADGSKLETIGNSAFRGCDSLKSIKLPSSLTTIGASAFEQCDNLTNVTIQENSQLNTIGTFAFLDCGNLS
ncbi:MAG: leucine-rich repeat domain-containing protein, partial [Clostridia bacterium]|nr:leucine-rich repeat domain-containing protein [Clostridia bacterium]